MSNLFDDIRSAFELEVSLAGPLVPIDQELAEAGEGAAGKAGRTVTGGTTPENEDEADPALSSAAAEPGLFELGRSARERFIALIPADSPLHSFTTLEEVEAWVAATELISLDRARLNPVFGVGNPHADLMVIGEAPGADEDRQGEPFVGRAGQLLNRILQAIRFERQEVYIANILKSRPPNNRDPLPAEVDAHMPILYKQIALIGPRIILCVGKTAGNSLLGKNGSLKSLRGIVHDFHGIPVMVTYHPAALLRNPQWKNDTWEDVKKLRVLYDRMVTSP